jgi:hypothetical protein
MRGFMEEADGAFFFGFLFALFFAVAIGTPSSIEDSERELQAI